MKSAKSIDAYERSLQESESNTNELFKILRNNCFFANFMLILVYKALGEKLNKFDNQSEPCLPEQFDSQHNLKTLNQGLKLGLAVLAAFSISPNNAQADNSTSSVYQTGIEDSQSNSINWSGFSTNIDDVAPNYVQDDFIVPKIECSNQQTNSVVWVGLGSGDNTSDVLYQTGIAMNCDSDGSKSNPKAYPNYYAWWETYPNNNMQFFNKYLPIQPSDLVVASVARGTVSGEVIMNLKDFGAANRPKLEWSISKKLNNTTVPSIAECIVEKPQQGPLPPPSSVYTEYNDNPQNPLTNFGTIEFPAEAGSSIEQGCRVGQDGDFSTLSSYDYQTISQSSQTYVTNYSLVDQYSSASLDQTSQPSYSGKYQVNWLQGGTVPQLKP